jgi:hypothetical protein
MATFTRDWNEASPAGTDDASSGDDEIRNFKVEVSDRLKALVYGFIAGENDGVPGCKNLPFKVQSGDPTVGASTIVFYAKDVSNECHWYFKDESGDVRQVTKAAGLLNILAGDYAANSVDEDDIQLANDAYMTALDAAGTGTVDLIKAGTNDLPTLPDSSEMASNAAPTEDEGIVNKKFVDDSIKGDAPTANDSEANAMLKAHAYLAQTSGFVTAFLTNSGNALAGYVGATDDPAGAGTQVGSCQGDGGTEDPFLSFFVGSGKYFEITISAGTPTITWTPLVSGGGAPIDQD